jgi:hypothetical protein
MFILVLSYDNAYKIKRLESTSYTIGEDDHTHCLNAPNFHDPGSHFFRADTCEHLRFEE